MRRRSINKLFRSSRHLTLEPLEARRVLDSTVVFSELLYHPASDNEAQEWIELHNQMAIDMDISDWRLSGAVDFTFADRTVIDGGGYLVIAADPAFLAADGFDSAIGPYQGRLANSGETIQLIDNSDRLMDELSYGDSGQWPVGPDGSGSTLAKIDRLTASAPAENWTTSEQIGGTPGAANFIVEVIERISLEPISRGSTASVFVPTDNSLATVWSSADYVEGTNGESWTSGPTAIGFDASASVSYADTVVADDPLAYWRFGESDNNQTATNLGTLGTIADGSYSGTTDLSADSLVNDPNDKALKLGLTKFATSMMTGGFEKFDNGTGRTIEFWFALDGAPSVAAALVGDGDSGFDYSHLVYITGDNKIQTLLLTAGNPVAEVESERAIEVGEVVHVVSSWDAATGQISLFLDGQQAATTTTAGTNPVMGDPINTNNPIFVGADDRTFLSVNARIDEVAIYNKPLTEMTVANHFAAGQPTLGAQVATDVETAMHGQNASAYIRLPFELPDNVAFDQLGLDIRYDDGFVAYLNGVEVARRNAPASVGFNAAATADRSIVEALTTESINLAAHVDTLRTGQNMLAIQGLNDSASNEDFLISPELSVAGNTIPAAAPPAIAITEVASALDVDFRIELRNDGDQAVNLAGYVLAVDGATPAEFVLPDTTIQPGGYLSFNEATLGLDPVAGDRLFLFRPGKTGLLDARVVTNRLRGRSVEHDGRWLYPDVATFGAANSFDFQDDIVINEIMYHAQPQYATQQTGSSTNLVSFDDEWQYTAPDNGLDGLTPAWQEPAFNDDAWDTGAATFGASDSPVDYAQTVLADGPLAYWRLGESIGPLIADATGNGNDGTADAGVLLGQQSLIGGAGDTAINTSGANRVTVPSFEKFPAGSTGFSVEYWIKVNETPGGFAQIVGDGEAGSDFYLMNYLTSGRNIRPHYSFAVSPVSMDSQASLNIGQVYHVVTTWDQVNGTGSIYIDGQLDSSITTTTSIPDNTGNQIFIGKDNREQGANLDLDEVAIYNRPLSAEEIAEHFNAGSGAGFNTQLPIGPETHYFRTEFEFDGVPAETALTLETVVDDGAVYYLNGTEIYRRNMPNGVITHTTLASSAVGTAITSGEIAIPSTALVGGTNVLAVEVHQATVDDSDVLFSAEIKAESLEGQERPFLESAEEWIELFNRGTTTVDLTNWQLTDAVQFDFPVGTMIEPGEYLLVARDANELAAKYPAVAGQIVGSFSGSLNNSTERIELEDANENPADEVRYFEGGKWPAFADGGGSSLELRDPFADNANGAAWAASDEAAKSNWRTYTYRGIAANLPGANAPTNYNEFSFGLLDSGELLIDDVSVIENPAGAAVQFLQNTSFDTDLASWRPLGTQHGVASTDPDDPSNGVFHLIATGAEEHLQNRVETTLKNGATFETVQLGQEYEISFRAKWLGGSPQLNTRLFFNLLPRTTILSTPSHNGTPGEQNSTFATNIGPTYEDVQHFPITPAPDEAVVVRATPSDPNGVASMTLMYSVDGAEFVSTTMTMADDGQFLGTVSGQAADSVVQFYVQGTDSLNATSTFPAAGPDSRAMFKVDQDTSTTGLHNIQIIMTPDDASFLGQNTNLMSNDRLGATVIYEGEVFYDAGVRLKGSEHGRPDPNRRSLSVAFPPDQLLRGVHATVGVDRSGGWRFGRTFGQDEILIHQFFNRAGDIPSTYNDLVFVDAPTVTNSTAILQLARFTDTYLDSQYENGSDGPRYEYELIYTMLASSGPESRKIASESGGVRAVPVGGTFGDNKEAYRHNFLIKNNLDKDDYSGMMALSDAFSKSGAEFLAATDEVIDVDQWLRSFAGLSLSGANDNYNSSTVWHNAQFYQRPADGKMLFFPFDMDFAFHLAPTVPLSNNSDLNKLRSSPDNEHAFLGHLNDIMNTSFNSAYMDGWVDHVNSLLPNQDVSSIKSWISQRVNFVNGQLPPLLPFSANDAPPTVETTTLLPSGAAASALVPSVDNGGNTLGITWTQTDFVETADWKQGITGVGYETAPADYADLVSLDVSEMFNTNQSVFVRIPFEYDTLDTEINSLKLRMKYDDGFVAYLNGQRVASANAPGLPFWNAGATAAHDDAAAVIFQDFDITDSLDALVDGQNVLAIHGLNTALDSSDLLILPELIAETIVDDGGGGGGEIIVDTPTAVIGGTGWVNVREIFVAGAAAPLDITWTSPTAWQATIPVLSGTHDVTFEAYDFQGNLIGSDTQTITSTATDPLTPLLITEINYNPYDPTDAELGINPNFEDDDFEFLEVQNVGTVPLNLQGFRVTDGVNYAFPNESLDPGEYAVVVRDTSAFAARYPAPDIRVLGEITSGGLSNAGERLALVDGAGNLVIEIEYRDGGLWSEAADGVGPTLELVSSDTARDQLGKYYNWGSFGSGGSPGGPFVAPAADVIISEVLSNTDLPGMDLDAIEITNQGPDSIDLSGAWLSDSSDDLFKYQLPSLPALAPGESIVFDESDFNPVGAAARGLSRTPFSLNGAEGDDVWLVDGELNSPFVNVFDHVDFGAAISGESFGRDLHAMGQMIPLVDVTLGAPNAAPRVGPLVISEVNYNPGTPSAAALAADPNVTADDLDFVEVHNPTSETVDLGDWRIRGGIDLNFDAGTMLDAGGSLVVVSFDPSAAANATRVAAFRAHYDIDTGVALIGGYADQLNNDVENIILQRPDDPPLDDPDFVPHVIEDLVIYDDVAPWPTSANGLGDSLQRVGFGAGTDSTQWNAASPTPGSIVVDAGDFNDDGMVDAADIDLLFAAINENNNDPQFDVDGSGSVDSDDVTYLVETILGRSFGDANLDGRVDSADLNQVGIHWQDTADVGWADGDFTGDGIVNSGDLNLIGINWQAGVAARAARAAPGTAGGRGCCWSGHPHRNEG